MTNRLEEARDNARLIVAAVNERDALREVLRAAEAVIKHAYYYEGFNPLVPEEHFAALEVSIRKLLEGGNG